MNVEPSWSVVGSQLCELIQQNFGTPEQADAVCHMLRQMAGICEAVRDAAKRQNRDVEPGRIEPDQLAFVARVVDGLRQAERKQPEANSWTAGPDGLLIAETLFGCLNAFGYSITLTDCDTICGWHSLGMTADGLRSALAALNVERAGVVCHE